jgi:hypothetical protein
MIAPHLLITLGLLGCVLVVAIYGYSSGNMLVLAGLAAFSPLVYLVARPDVFLALTIALYPSMVTFPGFPQNFNAFYASSLAFCGLMVAHKIINKKKSIWQPVHTWLVCFLAVMLFTAYIRGFGLRVLGGAMWGGAQYIQILIGALLFFAARDINLTSKLWRRSLLAFCLLSTLPVLAQWAYALSGGVLYHLYYFIVPDFGAVSYMRGLQAGSEMTRLQVANITSTHLFTLALLIRPRRNSFIPFLLLAGAAIVAAGISGHRIALIYNILLAVTFALMRRNATIFARLFTPYTAVFGFMLVLVIMTAPLLPLSFQRSLSWIPFMPLAPDVALDASGTLSWRFMVWRHMLSEIPNYLWLGKGFAFSMTDLPTVYSGSYGMDTTDMVLTSRNYHNGMLSLLLDLGLAGFVCGIGFLVTAIRTQWKNLGRAWHSRELGYFHRVMFASLVAQVLVYFFLAGGPTSFVAFFVYYLILSGLVATDAILAKSGIAQPAPKGARPARLPATSLAARPIC